MSQNQAGDLCEPVRDKVLYLCQKTAIQIRLYEHSDHVHDRSSSEVRENLLQGIPLHSKGKDCPSIPSPVQYHHRGFSGRDIYPQPQVIQIVLHSVRGSDENHRSKGEP